MREHPRSIQIIASALIAAVAALPVGSADAAAVGDFVGKTPAEIVETLERQGYKIEEVEMEGDVYEVEATIDGKTYEIHVDPETGTVLDIGEED